MPPSSARPYHSPRRQATARQTREAILDAAHELFVNNGYVATTIEQIAERAGVSKPTVFASVGSKRVVLKELRDRAVAGDDVGIPVRERPWYREALEAPDQRQSLRLHARNMVMMHKRYADLHDVVRAGAGADPELRELWDTSERERRSGAGFIVDALLKNGPLKTGLDRATAIDVLWALTSAESYQRLVGTRGWRPDRYESWLAQTFIDQLLPPMASRPTSSARARRRTAS